MRTSDKATLHPGLDLRQRPSPNHGARRGEGGIDMLVLHYTGMISAAAALNRLCDPAAEVSAHYLVEEDGTAWQLVDEARRAWHAGEAFWAGTTDVNSRSIGIEIVNPGHEFGYRPFPEAQMAAVEALACAILARHQIPPHRVVGHSDIAPARKEDPGELFDWPRLARAGVGLWPDFTGCEAEHAVSTRLYADLAAIGYAGPDRVPIGKVIAAFQRRFRPARVDGAADGETLARIARAAEAFAASTGQASGGV